MRGGGGLCSRVEGEGYVEGLVSEEEGEEDLTAMLQAREGKGRRHRRGATGSPNLFLRPRKSLL